MTMSGQGWIKLNRAIQGHWVWTDAEYLKAWIDLIFLAEHRQKQAVIGGRVVDLEPGVVYTTKSALSRRWGWDRRKTDRFLKLLEDEQMCVTECAKNGTTISLVNWAKYQLGCTTDAQRMHNECTTEDPIYTTNTNLHTEEQKKKKDSVITESKEKFKPPTLDEVKAYCEERNNGIDAEAFVAFYESKGWKVGNAPMKSWRAAVVTWERKRSAEQTAPPPKKSRFRNYEERDVDYEALFGGQGC